MKTLLEFVTEKLKISKEKAVPSYKYKPETTSELRELVRKRIEEDGPNVDLNDIDVSELRILSRVFYDRKGFFHNFNGDVSKWDVSNAEFMTEMFYGCDKFNCDLSEWDTSNVMNMSLMFASCDMFEGNGIENWNVSKVENMFCMFSGCTKFNADISKWDVSKVNDFGEMFDNCLAFNQDLENWNVSENAMIEDMFLDCKSMKNLPSWYDEEEN